MRAAIALICLVLAACGSETASTATDEVRSDESVFEPLSDALERAEGVQDTLNQRAEEQRRRIEEGP